MAVDFDRKLIEKLSRGAGRTRAAPDLSGPLGECSKQFQLWDVLREELDLIPARLDRIERARPLEAAGPGFQAIAADCTKEFVRLAPASELARRGYDTFRAMKRLVLKKPYKTGD